MPFAVAAVAAEDIDDLTISVLCSSLRPQLPLHARRCDNDTGRVVQLLLARSMNRKTCQ